MFNKYILGSALVAGIILSGCSSKEPTVDTSAKTTTEAPKLLRKLQKPLRP